jgi:hypothetical protein
MFEQVFKNIDNVLWKEAGCTTELDYTEQLAEMQKIIDAEKSDLFDVLGYVAYALPPVTREDRAARGKIVISLHFKSK